MSSWISKRLAEDVLCHERRKKRKEDEEKWIKKKYE